MTPRRAPRRLAPLICSFALLAGSPPGPVAGQLACDDPAVRIRAAPPSLDGFRLLFQQNGVSFYTRAPAGAAAGPAELVIRNGNRYPVEVSYTLEAGGGEGGPRAVALGRHCAEIPSLQYASTSDSVPGGAGALRVRNLTIADLSPSPASAAPAASQVGRTGAAPGTVPGDGAGTTPAGSAAAAPDSARSTPPAAVPARPSPGGPAPATATRERPRAAPLDLLRDGVTAALSLASVAFMLVAGVWLILPIAGAIAVLAVAALGSLRGRGRPGEGG